MAAFVVWEDGEDYADGAVAYEAGAVHAAEEYARAAYDGEMTRVILHVADRGKPETARCFVVAVKLIPEFSASEVPAPTPPTNPQDPQ